MRTEQLSLPIPPGEVHVGVATTIADKIGQLTVLTETYNTRNYLDLIQRTKINNTINNLLGNDGLTIIQQELPSKLYDEFIKNGLLLKTSDSPNFLFFDKYYWSSIPFIAKNESGYIGSARLIIRDTYGLPTTNDARITILPKYTCYGNELQAELSQLAVKKKSKNGISLGLLKSAYQYSKKNNISAWLATIDNHVLKIFNGTYMNFNLPKIGPSINYLGSTSTPIIIDLDTALINADTQSVDGTSPVAAFIRGTSNTGFEDCVNL